MVAKFIAEFRQFIHIKLIASIIRPIKTIFRVKKRIINLAIVMLPRSSSRSLDERTPIKEATILLNHIL